MNEESLANLSLTVSERDHTEGSAAAMVTLIEYGDYQCSQCQAASRIVEELRQQFGFRELRFVFRHFPLTQIHPHAFKAAEAAEAAGGQGKFWQMHRRLFELRGDLTDGELVETAAEIGLNVPQFLQGLSSRRYAGRVRAGIASGIANGVSGTPTFFINNELHNTGWNFDLLHKAVRQAALEENL